MTNRGKLVLGAPKSPLPGNGVYGETSIWLRLHWGGQYAEMVQDFLRQAFVEDVPVVTSNVTFGEIRHVLRSQIFANEAEKLGWKRPDGSGDWNRFAKKASASDLNQANAMVSAEYQRVKGLIEGLPGVMIPSYEDNSVLQNAVDSLMTKYPLDHYDAKHVAIARSWGLNSMASTDGDYAILENTNLYSVPNIIAKNGPVPKPALASWVFEPWEQKPEKKD